jgi:transcription antitermination factor NusG
MSTSHHTKRKRRQDAKPPAFKVGAAVRLKNGPMAGEVGKIDNVHHGMFSVNIRNIVRMTVTEFEIEAAAAG